LPTPDLRCSHFSVLHVNGLLLEDDVELDVGVAVGAAVVLDGVSLVAGRDDFNLEEKTLSPFSQCR